MGKRVRDGEALVGIDISVVCTDSDGDVAAALAVEMEAMSCGGAVTGVAREL